MVKVRFGSLVATVNHGKWACDEAPVFAQALAVLRPDFRLRYVANLDAELASAAAERLGGTIVSRSPDKTEAGLIY